MQASFKFLSHKNLLGIAAFLFFIAALVGLFNKYLPLKPEQEAFKKKIERKTRKQLRDIEKGIAFFDKHIEADKAINFSVIQREFDHPFFIYKNGNLKLWTSSKFKPEYKKIKGNYSRKMIFLDNGKFLVRKKVLNHFSDVYEIYAFIRLTYNYPLENEYIKNKTVGTIFPCHDIDIKNKQGEAEYDIESEQGDFLFSVGIQYTDNGTAYVLKWLVFAISMGGIVFLLWGIYVFCEVYIKAKHGVNVAFFTLVAVIFLLRGLMLLLYFPQSYIDIALFDPKIFASSSITPSLGDLLFNTLGLFIIAVFLFNNYYRSCFIKKILGAGRYVKGVLLFITPALIILILYSIYNTLRLIYFNSQISLDVTQELSFGYLKAICFVIYFFTVIIFFLTSHALLRIYNQIRNSFRCLWGISISATGLVVFHILYHFYNDIYPVVSLVGIIYVFLVCFYNLTGPLTQFRYTTYLYLFFTAAVTSVIAAYSVYQFHNVNIKHEKKQYAGQLVNKNDVLGEYLLAETRNLIQKDSFIKNWFIKPFANKALILEKIKRLYVSDYFDKYNLNIRLFNHKGQPYYGDEAYSYRELLERYDKKAHQTEYPSVYLVKDPNNTTKKKYLNFITMEKHHVPVGYILLELVQRKVVPNSVYPELLVDQEFNQSIQKNSFSYGIYDHGELVSSSGKFNYLGRFHKLDKKALKAGKVSDGFLHHLFEWNGKKIIVSNPVYPFKNIYANFSFLFLIMALVILLVIVVNTFYYKNQRFNNSFITKMHILVNLFYFLPVFVVSLTIFSVTNKNFRENLKQTFIQKAESVSNSISVKFDQLSWKKEIMEDLTDHLTQMGKYTESDINLYDKSGKLLVSTQPKIFENNLLSPLINPDAYEQVIEKRAQNALLHEKVGDFRFNTVYIGIKSFDTGELLGVVGLPFFESKKEFENEVLGVMTSILNIFTTTFLVFLTITYFGTRYLTVPLRLLTDGIRKISLKGENKPLKYQSNDEIGLLVNEYNSMLVKLENSKRALAQSEKENAWREMARQVAHEIKNPLTPMRLTLQHLQKNLDNKSHKDERDERIKKSVETLLIQVDNLNEIATSFHSFTQMPLPKQEKVDLSKILSNTINLYEHEGIEASVPQDIQVMADEKLLTRIFTNIILNGLQSIPNDRQKKLIIDVQEEDEYTILISFTDNGNGIPEEIRHKVFVPNFSTKYAGSGIGLAVARKGIEHFGGQIWFETETGVGTTFYIRLHRVPSDSVQEVSL